MFRLTIQDIIDTTHQLSQDEQRALAGSILADPKLEAFVEELQDHLACEAAVAEGSAELLRVK